MQSWANAWYVADRFAHHSVIVDATIVRTIQLGCFGARGSGTGMGSGDTIYAPVMVPQKRLPPTTGIDVLPASAPAKKGLFRRNR